MARYTFYPKTSDSSTGCQAREYAFYICSVEATEKPTSGFSPGDFCLCLNTGNFYKCLTADVWTNVSSGGGGSLPTGVIVMWSGTLATIPSGFVLCDGQNGTPDLRDRFVKGAASGANPGATGGANTHSHTAHPALSHSGAAVADHAAQAHSGAAVADHASHTHTYSQVPNHVHGLSAVLRTATTGGATTQVTDAQDTSSTADVTRKTDNPDGGVAQGTTNGPSAALSHAVTQPSDHPALSHNVTQPGDHASQSHSTESNEPVYYAVAFIMKT